MTDGFFQLLLDCPPFLTGIVAHHVGHRLDREKRPSDNHDNNGLPKTKENLPDPLMVNCSKYMLTSREVEILKLLREGLPYKLIASQLNISNRTVTTHVANIFAKVNVTNKMELVRKVVDGLES